jgi:hypothetical protein
MSLKIEVVEMLDKEFKNIAFKMINDLKQESKNT